MAHQKACPLQERMSGFSLIELMVVIVIIGILAALAIPKYTGVSNNAKAVEAHTQLKFLYDLEESYHQLNDRFIAVEEGQNSPELGFIAPRDARYVYRVDLTSEGGFIATATEKVDINSDGLGSGLFAVYRINHRGEKTGSPAW